jgi:hypothetical protein
MALDATRQRLRSIADDCGELASQQACPGEARGLLHLIAHKADEAMTRWYGSDPRKAVVALEAGRKFAQWMADPDTLAITVGGGPQERAVPSIAEPRPTPPPRPLDTLNARQLAGPWNMSTRQALRVVEHGLRRGLDGFYKEGRYAYARREAFDQLRASRLSELRPNRSAAA